MARFDDLVPKSAALITPGSGGTGFDDLTPKSKESAKYTGWGDYLTDLARNTLGQGVALGFGDELVAGVRSLASGKPYAELVAEERDAIDRFRKENPGTALATELAGGILTPGLGAARFLSAAPNLLSKMGRGAAVGATFGAVGGVGGTESLDRDEIVPAVKSGAALGAGLGAALPVAGRMIGSTFRRADTLAQQASDSENAAQLYLADKLRSRGLTEKGLSDDLARGQGATQFSGGKADLPETIADITPTTQRVLRGIKVGGDADEVIEPFLSKRQAGELDFTKGAEAGGQHGRLKEDLRLSLRLTQKDLADKLSSITGKRSAEADKLFGAARDNSEAFDLSRVMQAYGLRAMDMADDQQRAIVSRALDLFNQGGVPGSKFPVDNVKRFHESKMALDDLINRAEVKEQGNLRRILLQMKHDMMDGVFKPDKDGNPTINAGYRKALDSYASRSELLNAAELGRDFARGTEQVTDRMFRNLSEGEKAMFRAAWQHHTTQKMGDKAAGPTTDFTQSLRTPNTGDELRMILPPTAGKSADFPGGNREKLTELVKREQRISDTSRKVLGNSSTAEKAADSIDIGRIARVTRYIKDTGGLIQAAAASLSDVFEKMGAIKGQRAQYLAKKMLTTDPAEQQAFLTQVEQTYGKNVARRLNEAFYRWAEGFEASAASMTGRAQAEEQRDR
jgi:hypothetical protein